MNTKFLILNSPSENILSSKEHCRIFSIRDFFLAEYILSTHLYFNSKQRDDALTVLFDESTLNVSSEYELSWTYLKHYSADPGRCLMRKHKKNSRGNNLRLFHGN